MVLVIYVGCAVVVLSASVFDILVHGSVSFVWLLALLGPRTPAFKKSRHLLSANEGKGYLG